MFSHFCRAAGLHRLDACRLALVALLCLIPLTLASGQGVGSTRNLPSSSAGGGSNIIKGRVILPSGMISQRIRVRLESNMTTTVTTSTDADGSFIFNSLVPGTYTIIVEVGPEFEPAMESVTIDVSPPRVEGASSGPRMLEVPILLRPKGSPASNAFAGVPKQAVELYNQALESEKKGDNKKAVEQLKNAIIAHPTFGIALNELGVLYMKQKEYDKAADALAQAVKLSPNAFPPRLNYGMALWNAKKFPEAETELRAAVKQSDNSQSAHYYLGLALVSQKKIADAETEFERTISLGKGKEDIAMAHYYLGGILWGKKEYQRAADELETYLKLSPKAPNAEQIRATIKDLRSKK